MITAMLFAGGKGARMKSVDLPKQFLEVGGKPIIIHTMEHFARHPMVDHIVVACKEDWIDHLENLIEQFNVPKVKSIVPGGASGFDSIHNGVVATHEFSRDPEDIETKKHKTAVPVTPSIDSLLYSEDGMTCGKSYQRSTMYITQAPQGYTMERILWAHDQAYKRGILDPVSSSELFIELGEKVHIFLGERFNIKVTTPEDLTTLRSQYYYENYKKFAKEELKYGL